MSAAQDVLAELEALGAIGDKVPAPVSTPPPAPSEVTLEKGPPGILRDDRGPKMLLLCEQAVELLNRSIEAQVELRDVFIALHDLWVEDEEGPGDGEEDPEEEEEPDSEEEQEEETEAPPAAAKPVGDSDLSPADLVPPEPAAPLEEATAPSVPPSPDGLSPRRQRFLAQMRKEAEKAAAKREETPA
jgi:hypothetical protein